MRRAAPGVTRVPRASRQSGYTRGLSGLVGAMWQRAGYIRLNVTSRRCGRAYQRGVRSKRGFQTVRERGQGGRDVFAAAGVVGVVGVVGAVEDPGEHLAAFGQAVPTGDAEAGP